MDNSEDPGDDHWDHESIMAMLSLYLQNIDKFRNPKIRKKNVWIDISNAIGKCPDSCDKKFRNLKHTYIRLLKKKVQSGATWIKWPFFDLFEEIYRVDGEYQPEIQQKIKEGTADIITKALLNIGTSNIEENPEAGQSSSTVENEEVRKRLLRKRNAEFRKVTLEMRERQKVVEEKLDKLINIIEESNSIQRERNRLFEHFLSRLNHTNANC